MLLMLAFMSCIFLTKPGRIQAVARVTKDVKQQNQRFIIFEIMLDVSFIVWFVGPTAAKTKATAYEQGRGNFNQYKFELKTFNK
jgi:hypothetical protein